MVDKTLDDFANLLSFDNPPGANRRKISDDFDVEQSYLKKQRSEGVRMRNNSVRGERPKTNLIDEIRITTDKLGRDMGLIDDDDIMPEVGSIAYEQIKVTKLMNEDVVSLHNEPLDPLMSVEDFEFETKQEEVRNTLPGNSQNPLVTNVKKKKYSLIEMEKIMLEKDTEKHVQNVEEADLVSQSSTSSRAESFKKAGFGSLIKDEEDEQELDNFFVAERHYLILTNAGKPVYSMVGDIYALSPIFATLYAIVSKAQTFTFKEPPQEVKQAGPKKEMVNPYLNPPTQQETQEEQQRWREEDSMMDDETGNSVIQSLQAYVDGYKFAFVIKGGCLIYIAMSRCKSESISFLKKQLEMLHLQLISITSRQIVVMLRQNPSFDLMGEMMTGLPLIKRMASGASKNVATFLNMYQPLRMSRPVAEHVEYVVTKNKPQPDHYFFGMIVAENTVVSVFKPSQKTIVEAADVNLIINFMTEHSRRLKKRAPCFFSICVPGLTEEYKMSVFFHTSNRTSRQFGLQLVIVTEEASAQLMDRFEVISQTIFNQLSLEHTIERIKKLEEVMFQKMKLREIQQMVVCNSQLEQYTTYNCMSPYDKVLRHTKDADLSLSSREYVESIRHFERLYHMYQSSKNKKDVMVAKKYQLVSYGLLAKGEIVVMVCIAHNRTTKSIGQILKEQMSFSKTDKDDSFLH